MLQWLRSVLGPSPSTDRSADERLERLERDVAALKRSELDREASLQDTLDKLERFYKRLRQRSKLDQDHETTGEDDVTRMIRERRAREGKV